MGSMKINSPRHGYREARLIRHGLILAEIATERIGLSLKPSTVKKLQSIAAHFGIGKRDKGHSSIAAIVVESYAQGKYFCSCGSIHALPECHQEGK